MKTTAEPNAIQKSKRDLINWTMAVILLPLLAMTNLSRAQSTTNLIYQDNFARVGVLDGSTPDTVDATGAAWQACNIPQFNAQVQTDGSEIALTNTPGTTNGIYLNGFLPFTPQVGHIYTLSCKMRAISGGAQWLAMGFAANPITNNYYASYKCGAGWFLLRGDGTQVQAFGGPGNGNGTTLTSALTSTTNTFTVVLNTTTGNQNYGWTATFYTNGVLAKTYVAPYCNYPVKYVGIGADAAQGYFQQFTLTDVLTRQSAPVISEQPQNATVQVGQTATFWVGATNDYPSASYQWMTISSGGVTNVIPNATNAFYTTPALDPTYNGLSYSVAIANVIGSTNSTSATLTVVSGPPSVYSATKTLNTTNIVVSFSKAIDPATGLNAGNYTLTVNGAPSGITVLSASYGSASNNIILTTSTLNTNTGYYLSVQNVEDLFGNAISGSDIVPVLPAGLVLFVRGDSGVVLDNNGLVDQWVDQTTNANTAVQFFGVPTAGITGPAARPMVSSINGFPALGFGSPTKSFLIAPDAPSLRTMISNTTMYAVAQFSAVSPANELVNKTWGNLPAPFDWDPSTGENVQYGNGGNNAPASGTGGTIAANNPYVLSSMLTFAGGTTNFAFYLNGGANGSGTIRTVTGGGIFDGGLPLWIGGRSDLVNGNMKGQIAEIMLFNTSLSGADRTNVDNYLGQKYFPIAITMNLPATTTSSNGFSVTYTFAASLGSVHGVSFQWQENGTNIPGAFGSTYTTPILGPNDNGDTFNVVVTLPNGSTTNSTLNTLTVLNEPPYVASAGITIWSPTNIMVLFDEAVDPATATSVANYSLNNGASIISAAIGSSPNRVVLTTSPLAWNANPGYYTLSVSNVLDLYNNTMVAASLPLGLFPSAALWVIADTGVTQDSGTNTVSLWDDQSGNGNNLYGPGIGYDPAQITNASGDVVVYFTANPPITNYMYGLSSSTLAITGDMSVFAVMSFTNLSDGKSGEIVSKTGNSLNQNKNIPAPYDYAMGAAGAGYLRGNGNGTVNGVNYGSFSGTNAPSLNRSHVIAVSETGPTVSHFIDGRTAGVGLLSNGFQESGDQDNGTSLFIGQRWDGFNNLKGSISEMIIVNSSVAPSDVASLDSYFATRHNFKLYETNQPKLTLSVTNQQLAFSWPLDHTGWTLQAQTNGSGVGILTNWTDVPNSTSTNQVTVPIVSANGSVFYRLISR